jgi:hypothetical protein
MAIVKKRLILEVSAIIILAVMVAAPITPTITKEFDSHLRGGRNRRGEMRWFSF